MNKGRLHCWVSGCMNNNNNNKNIETGTILYSFPTSNILHPHKYVRRQNWLKFAGYKKYVKYTIKM